MGTAQIIPFPTVPADRDSRPWGDSRTIGMVDCFRIGFWNCGGFPTDNRDGKNKVIQELLLGHEFDVFGFSECNVYWPAIDVSQRLPERTLGWFETRHLTSSYLYPWNPKYSFQVGGTSLWSINSATHRVITSGIDNFRLGRWVWTTYRGRNGLVLRVVVAYRCVENQDGPLSAWSQQKLILTKKNISTNPRVQFVTDFVQTLDTWLDAGDQIVIGLDLNENVLDSAFTAALRQRGLIECITSRHGQFPPPTYHRGSKAIDGIFTSPALSAARCGYLPFLGDHRVLWIDLPLSLIFDISLPPSLVRARRLKLEDPRVVHQYQIKLHAFYSQHNILPSLTALQETIHGPLTSTQMDEFERLDILRVQGMRLAENKCRKLRMGSVPFTPEYSKLAQLVLCWNLICKLLSGKRVDSRFFARKLKQNHLTMEFVRSLTLAQALSHRHLAYSSLRRYSTNALPSRQAWLEQLSQARADAGLLTAEQEYQALISRERQRRNARIIKSVLKPSSSFGLSQLHEYLPDGTIALVTDRSAMERLILADLAKRFNQAALTPFATPPLSSLVGPLGISDNALAILNGTFQIPIGTDPWTAKLIPHLRYTTSAKRVLASFPLRLSTIDHCSGWKKMSERTSPSFFSYLLHNLKRPHCYRNWHQLTAPLPTYLIIVVILRYAGARVLTL
jgi:hypothetical protein